ncbi:winged helix-turn-helix transcriptional regulator [Pseudorhodoplanes sinuspersici]|uniref:Uncharacterized protein n=1 Tax=Pseudorhodoplanes sinuspersici TaxID=1235591 RepID=A0A1W6ZQE2_9HYPH|nr:helix-turn-helix domain-containing protein [Pseudorhodoplanes sinuspersici]ARP98984.1 hypothetical protein CAK95_07740 [Pseudorhodoplanes sinuspersici]RKE69380.1 HxlR family transcriptional regulator [Pseudorhodoplanes sinuspersici]
MAQSGYGQFCPVAKGAEIVATRWTPLILREIMSGERSFNDIHRGVPLMSRALLAERLRQLEHDGIVAKRPRKDQKGHDWALTTAGDALREVVDVIGRWGLIYGRDKITPGDRDSTVLMWALRRRVDREALPPRRVVVRFDLSGVARCRTGLRKHWLVLEPSDIDVCYKDPGFPVDVTVTGEMSAMVSVYLGYATWRDAIRKALRVEGDREISKRLESWLQLDRIVGRDLPIVPPAGTPSAPTGRGASVLRNS